MSIKRYFGLSLAALFALSIAGSAARSAPAPAPVAGALEGVVRILTVSYGEFVPVDELEARREELIRRAFQEGRVRVVEQRASGTRVLPAGKADLDWALRGSAAGSPAVFPGPATELAGAAVQSSGPDDYDGDGFGPAEEVAPLRGEYIADLPRVSIDFNATVEPGIVALITGTEETEEWKKTYFKENRDDNYTASSAQEFKANVKHNLSVKFGNPLKVGIFKFVNTAAGLTATSEYSRTRSWNQTVTHQVQRYMEEYQQRKANKTITVKDDAGFVRTQILLTNTAHFPAPLTLIDLKAEAVAYSPRTGVKLALGATLVAGRIDLFSGAGNNWASSHLEYTGINTGQMEDALYQGYMFDFEFSGNYGMTSQDGTIDWKVRTGEVAAKTAWLQVNYGDANAPVVRQVALQARGGGDLTVEKGLQEVFGAGNVAFATDPNSGRRVVTRVNHRENRHADRDFNTLSPEEQAEYGRWVIGYRFGTENLATDLFIDSTRLFQDDMVALYYLTKADFIPVPPDPDVTVSVDLPAQGTIEEGGLLAVGEPVRVGDVVEIDVTNRFTLYHQTSQFFESTYNTVCQKTLYDATCYFRTRATESDFVPIPDVDWYRLKVSFGTTNPRTWLSPSQLGATIVQRSDFPEYRFAIRFTVTAAHLNQQPQGVLRVAVEGPQGNTVVGCTGRASNGQFVDCRQNPLPAEEHAAAGQASWYKYTPDVDIDGYAAVYHYGDDWDDADFTVFPNAPELWDGKDNDQDGQTERVSVAGPIRLGACETGTYTAEIHEFSGALTYTWWRREVTANGKTAWVQIGNGPSINASMTCANAALARAGDGVAPMKAIPETGFDLKVEAAAEGSDYRPTATLAVRKGDPPPCQKDCKEEIF